ncbi:MAG: LarC family nickel insertion protein, partial [Prochlorotrichaceae cyanobacterium]
MCLGALIHAGVPLKYLEESLAKLGITEEYTLSLETVQRRGMTASKLQVNLQVSNPPVRHLATIETLIGNAYLPPVVEEWSLAIFRKLALAEAAVHGSTPEAVHFHEVGATDALVDIVGTCLGLHWLGIEAVYCSALPTGGGTVRAAHGRLPVPVPAVL